MRGLAAMVLALGWVAGIALADETLPYKVDLSGVDGELKDRVAAESRLVSQQGQGAPSLAALRRRAEEDGDALRALLRAQGWYEGKVEVTMDDGQRPVPVRLRVEPGPEFRLAAFDVSYDVPPGQLPPQPVPLEDLGVDRGGRAQADEVVKAGAALLKALAGQGYPLARIAARQAVVDHAARTMRVAVTVATGPQARFGPLSVQGVSGVDEQWVRNRVPWQAGERFSLAAMDLLRKRLMDSRLFSSVRLSTAEAVDAEGRLPVTLGLTEAKARSVGVGGTWSTTEGLGGQAFWETRNLLGGAERLRGQVSASRLRRQAGLDATAPDFLAVDQDLIAAAKADEQTTPAYATRTLGASAGLSWLLGEAWRASASTAFERTWQDQEDVQRRFTLLSWPLELRHDDTDDLLDPTRGNRSILTLQPFLDMQAGLTPFTRAEMDESAYWQILDEPRLILAGWGRFGTLQGAGLFDIPADKRFYAGGAGSVRGFGYQKAGPIDSAGVSTGGRSELAFGGEVRIKATDTIGVVPFVEGGRAYAQSLPDVSQHLFWGAGLGLRYFTPIGPVRADVAVPLNPRPDIDGAYQVYLSLGQAF